MAGRTIGQLNLHVGLLVYDISLMPPLDSTLSCQKCHSSIFVQMLAQPLVDLQQPATTSLPMLQAHEGLMMARVRS